jgi:ATP-binding cassette, subfamily B, bacterial
LKDDADQILDEATAFLDASVESRLKDTVRALMAGKTTLVISHRLSTLRGADKVVTLDAAGRVVTDGTADLPKRRPRLGPAAADPGADGCQGSDDRVGSLRRATDHAALDRHRYPVLPALRQGANDGHV